MLFRPPDPECFLILFDDALHPIEIPFLLDKDFTNTLQYLKSGTPFAFVGGLPDWIPLQTAVISDSPSQKRLQGLLSVEARRKDPEL
jgi:hypothetical protein